MSTIAITSGSTTDPVAGAGFSFSVALTGASWTNGTSQTSPLSISGIPGAFICNQITSDSNTCFCTIYTGNSAGTLTVTDTVNDGTATIAVSSVRALRPTTGSTWYVLGGLRNPPAPRGTVVGTGASTTYCYQVIAINAAGKTIGALTVSAGMGNIPASASFPNYLFGLRVLTINNAPSTLNTSSYISLSWPAVPGATGYDILRSSDGSTWASLALNQSATTFNDQGGATSAYSLPSANTTSLGSDSNAGISPGVGNAFATAAKAASVAAAGDRIHFTNCVIDTSAVHFPDDVNLTGDSRTTSVLFNSLNSTAQYTCYRLPSNADVSDLAFENESVSQMVLGFGVDQADPITVDCNVYRCDVRGYTKSFSTGGNYGAGIVFLDCTFSSLHGCFGSNIVTVSETYCSTLNLIRCRVSSIGAVLLSGTETIGLQASDGFIFARDTLIVCNTDSQDPVGWQAAGVNSSGANACGLILINGNIFGRSLDFDTSNSGGHFSLWLAGSATVDPVKNANMLASLTPTIIAPNVYLIDPSLNADFGLPLASKVLAGTAFGPDPNGATVGTAT